ncbi:MAG: fructose-bisphosphate aldolase class I [Dehalococcoidia bacterium]|nr:fructose-bisphosphate aldolase class I [Dehalococcoidia bacterium]|tara:strand:- start:243 stop:1271 length:1029 start_codon:yes stop_codon:yes gene_type:complete
MDERVLRQTVTDLVAPSKGILAADESSRTIKRRFDSIGAESTEENRRAYRSLLLTTPGIGDYICGVILFEETLGQSDSNGTSLPQVAEAAGVVPGIKVDKGTVPLPGAPGDLVTEGLDGLAERLEGYKQQGARFAKWREVYNVSETLPSQLAVSANAEVLARYARICQEAEVVPIVEPEVLMDGGHSIGRCKEVTENVLHAVFEALDRHRVMLEGIVLKPNMVLPGGDSGQKSTPEEVADATLTVFRRAVPAAVRTINFLSGGQSAVESTANLNAINTAKGEKPWALSFSYGRGLQAPALAAWGGQVENEKAAQAAFFERARLNGLARDGQYEGETTPTTAD